MENFNTSSPKFFAVVTTKDQVRAARELVELKINQGRGGKMQAPKIRVIGCGTMGPQHQLVLVTSYEVGAGGARELLASLADAPELQAVPREPDVIEID